MSSLKSRTHSEVLERMMDFGRGCHDFAEHHAIDGLFIAQGMRSRPGSDPEGDYVLGLTIAFWFWFDDRSDRHLLDEVSPVPWKELISCCEGEVPARRTDSSELSYWLRLADVVRSRSEDPSAYQWWLRSGTAVFRAMLYEEDASRSGRASHFSECYEYGGDSTAAQNIFASAYVVEGLPRIARATDLLLYDLEHHGRVYQRLLNDLRSAKKEMLEGAQGRTSNTVIFLRNKGVGSGSEIISDALEGYGQLIKSKIAWLPAEDPFGKLYLRFMSTIDEWYSLRPKRYQEQPSPTDAEGAD